MIVILGAGHSGTRAISRTLVESGVYMGTLGDPGYDHVPGDAMLDAVALYGRLVKLSDPDKLHWDFTVANSTPVPDAFKRLVEKYLEPVLKSAEPRGWKLPETIFAYPWIAQMYPEAKFIHWERNPRDVIQRMNRSDVLLDRSVTAPLLGLAGDRCVSWLYQAQLVKAAPQPRNFTRISFESFVGNQEATLQSLEVFLGLSLARIPVDRDTLNRERPLALDTRLEAYLRESGSEYMAA